MSYTMDMSDPAVQDMLEQDKQEALAHIRVAKHDCEEAPWNHETTDGPLGDAYTCSVCGELTQVG